LVKGLEKLAARQFGVFTVEQAIERGISLRTLSHWANQGRLDRLAIGAYRFVAAPEHAAQRVMAAVLLGGDTAAVSHRCALWVYELLEDRPPVIDVTGGRRIGMRGVVVHRSRLAETERTHVGPMPVTRVERTLVDVAGRLSERSLFWVVSEAVRRGLTRPARVQAQMDATPARRAAGVGRLRGILRDARIQGPKERELVLLLRRSGPPGVVPQYEINGLSGRTWFVDAAYPLRRLAIELDGSRWHGSVDDHQREMWKVNDLVLLGWTALHFSPHDLDRRRNALLRQVHAADAAAAPTQAGLGTP